MRVGILTGGGDCPGLNAVIRAVGRRAFTRGWEAVGVRAGRGGLVAGIFTARGPRASAGLLPRATLHSGAAPRSPAVVVGVRGRHTCWIRDLRGIAGGAGVILIPEQPMTVEAACAEIRKRHTLGKDFSIVVVSEGYELTYESG